MSTIQVSIPQSALANLGDASISVPIAIPALEDVVQFSKALHVAGQPWNGMAFGWPADYMPEIKEENALFEEYAEMAPCKRWWHLVGLRLSLY